MQLSSLRLTNVGPIKSAEIAFGNLTVLVGPQATGKSIFLEFLKLLVDGHDVFRTFAKYGLDWGNRWQDFFDLYFGEGMKSIWSPDSEVVWNGEAIEVEKLVRRRRGRAGEKCFFIPAQRVLALSRDGWLRPFADYKPGDPYTVRDFSEKLRSLMELGLGSGSSIFPVEKRLKAEIRRHLGDSVFSGFSLNIDKNGPQKRLVLQSSVSKASFPFMVWSAGQREFVPLLLGLYWVMPSTKNKLRGSIKWVVIEELEMGLHPKAIAVMLLVVLDLLWRGYRVCLSTHSPQILDLVWALRILREHRAPAGKLLDLFGTRHTPAMTALASSALNAETKVYYFDPKDRRTRDISNLDPGSEFAEEAGWGGLAEFSGRVADEVAQVVAADAR